MIDVLCDLDGVIYRGDTPIDGAPEALDRLIAGGGRVTFVTNNSTRTPAEAAAKISRLTGVSVTESQVATSSQAAASILGPGDSPVLAVGETGVTAAVEAVGLTVTDDPAVARAVMVGVSWDVSYDDIARASSAVRMGARFVATNSDPTFPTEDGLLPGAGAIVAAIAVASGAEPEVAGKPNEAMSVLLSGRGIGSAWVVGDRLDTDIALAETREEWRSILVGTGVTDIKDSTGVADFVVADFSEAVDLMLGTRNRA